MPFSSYWVTGYALKGGHLCIFQDIGDRICFKGRSLVSFLYYW